MDRPGLGAAAAAAAGLGATDPGEAGVKAVAVGEFNGVSAGNVGARPAGTGFIPIGSSARPVSPPSGNGLGAGDVDTSISGRAATTS